MPDIERSEDGKLIECDACVQSFIMDSCYECGVYGHPRRDPTAHAIKVWELYNETPYTGPRSSSG